MRCKLLQGYTHYKFGVFVPVTRRVKGYTRFVGKYVAGRRKGFWPHKVYIVLIRIAESSRSSHVRLSDCPSIGNKCKDPLISAIIKDYRERLGFERKLVFTIRVCGEDNKYATLIFIITNARIGYIKMYSVYSERQTDCVRARLQELHIDICRLTK